jgi:hypothetical protein
MRIGGGKKHGQYYLGDGVIDATSTPSLSQIRARSTDASILIRPRPETSQQRILSLQVIPVLFVIHCYLHILALLCLNNVVKYCRPRSSNWRPCGRPIARGWRLWRPSAFDGVEAAAADGGGSPVHASSWAKDGCSSASFAIRYTATSTFRAHYSCKYEYDCLSLYVHA